jgi:uncharacterized protein (DUF2141 family)
MSRRRFCIRFVVLLALLLAGCAAAPPPPTPAGEGELVVEMSSFRSDRGVALVSLFASPDGFPGEPERALRNLSAPISGGRASAAFSGLPWGRYAVSVLHDENGNGRMETGWLGIPAEGHAVSNNVAHRFSAPAFNEATFAFDRPRQSLRIGIRYVERGGPLKH